MKYPDVAQRFSLILSMKNMSQTELANKAGLDKSFINHYVHGSHCPSNIKAQQIADVLNVNPLWLMGLSNDMNNKEPAIQLDDRSKEAATLFSRLSEEQQNHFLALMRSLVPQEPSAADHQ